MKKYWKDVSWKLYKNNNKNFKESSLLKLNSQKAKKKLKWTSVLTFKENIYLEKGQAMSGSTVAAPFGNLILMGNVMDDHFLVLRK